tara:strand:- start:632 stop:1222 length:591 start_codon:yes stop_codon:yes gene_type:complete
MDIELTNQLKKRMAELEVQIESAQLAFSKAQKSVNDLSKEYRMIDGLLGIHDDIEQSPAVDSIPAFPVDGSDVTISEFINHDKQVVRENGLQPRDLLGDHLLDNSSFEQAIVAILKEAGTPSHVSDIEKNLRKYHIPIPGKGDTVNIISRMRRDEDTFVRIASGTYGLVEWNLDPMPTKKRRRSKTNKRSRSVGRK